LPLSVLNVLLKGLLSKDRTCSQFKSQNVSSKIITLVNNLQFRILEFQKKVHKLKSTSIMEFKEKAQME
jgi:hypothetical protein